MAVKEAGVRDPVVKWARTFGVKHIRMCFRPGTRTGVPDDLFLLPGNPGLPVWIEFKRPDKEPTALQWTRIMELRNAGFLAEWFSDAGDAIAFLSSALGACTLHGASGRPFDVALFRRASAPAGRG